MQNGYFRLVNDSEGYGIALYQPKEYGDPIQLSEITAYLDDMRIGYDKKKIEIKESIRDFGTFEVLLRLYSEVSQTVKINVVRANA